MCHAVWGSLTYECHDICLHTTNSQLPPQPPWKWNLCLGPKNPLAHPPALCQAQSWNDTVPHNHRESISCLVYCLLESLSLISSIWRPWLICVYFIFVLIQMCYLRSVQLPLPPPFLFNQLSHEILLCLCGCFEKSLCVLCLKQTLSDHPTYYTLPKGHFFCTEGKALLLWLRKNKLNGYRKGL